MLAGSSPLVSCQGLKGYILFICINIYLLVVIIVLLWGYYLFVLLTYLFVGYGQLCLLFERVYLILLYGLQLIKKSSL